MKAVSGLIETVFKTFVPSRSAFIFPLLFPRKQKLNFIIITNDSRARARLRTLVKEQNESLKI